jgi:PST family polysaccharide transporter
VTVSKEASPAKPIDDDAGDAAGLRRRVFGGGHTVALRLVATVALKFVGVLIISRILGPANYGAYVAAYSLYAFVLAVGQAGTGVYLMQKPGALTSAHLGAATTYLLLQSTAIVVLVELLAAPLGAYAHIPGFPDVLRIIILALPVQTLSVPAQALVERRLDLKGVAIIELSTLTGYYACALPLALAGFGPSALAYALIFQYLLAGPITYAVAGVKPAFGWDAPFIRDMMRFVTGYSASGVVWQLRGLVNPFIVGPVLGAYSVGMIALTISVLEMLTLVRTMLWRITIAALTHLRGDTAKLRRIIGEGMEMHLLAIGAALLGFGWVGGLIVPVVFGARWLPIFHVYPYIALSYLTMATFNMHSAALTLLDRNWLLVAFQTANAIALAALAWFAVRFCGFLGYGYAEVGALPAYWLLHHFLERQGVAPRYWPAAGWWLAAAIGLFWRELGLWAIAAPFVALLLTPSPQRILAMAANLRRHGKAGAPTSKPLTES